MTAKDKIAKAKNVIANHHDILMPALAAIEEIIVENDPLLTACTNGEQTRYGAQYVDTLNIQQTVGLIVHEVLHPLLGHLTRLANQFATDPHLTNIGADYEINNFVTIYNEDAAFPIVLPPDAYVDVEKYGTLAAEVIIRKLYEDNPLPPPPPPPPPTDPEGDQDGPEGDKEGDKEGGRDNKEGKGSGNGQPQRQPYSSGEFEPAKTPAKAKEISDKWKEILSSTIQTAKLRGKGGGKFIQKLEELLEPPLDLEALLDKYTTEFCLSDESIRADKRYLAYHDICITGMEDEQHGTLVFVKDTSGSINDDILKSVVSIVQGASTKLRPRRLIVIDVDAEVQHVEEFGPNDDIPAEAKGRGGTDFRPAFDFIENNLEEARVIIYFTDGYGDFPEEEPSIPTLWVTYGLEDDGFPFGQVVNMNELIDQAV
jgi:predicted metal-dependent peptidase